MVEVTNLVTTRANNSVFQFKKEIKKADLPSEKYRRMQTERQQKQHKLEL